jgi:CelD/BcsL family acetyltransferase involved in cellulose biosynthesis
MAQITVDVRSGPLELSGAWDALAARAAPNIFMHPVALNAVTATGFARLRTLLAWDGPGRLVGLWALQERTVAPLWPRVLAAPPYCYAFVSDPVVDRERADEVVTAFLDTIAAARDLPNVLRLQYLDAESESVRGLRRVLAGRGGRTLTLADRARPFITREVGVKAGGSTRKKLRQDFNRLSAIGAVDIVNQRDAAAVRDAFEIFLALEAASWKGDRGTALLSNETDGAFVRRLIADLGAAGMASVALLRVDEKPVAAQVLLHCGGTAYTWKTAFDAAFAKYSPGMLLIDKITERLFAEGAVDAIESCSPDGSFMGQLWSGRRSTVDLLADVGRGASMNFAVVALGERAYGQARHLRNRWRSGGLWPSGRRTVAAPVRTAPEQR